MKPLEAILESLGAVLGVVLGLPGRVLGRFGASWGDLGGVVEELEGARRAPRPVFYEDFFVNLCCCLQSKRSMHKGGGTILCGKLQCYVGISWVARAAGECGVGHPVGFRAAPKLVFSRISVNMCCCVCQSVLLLASEGKHEQRWRSDFMP